MEQVYFGRTNEEKRDNYGYIHIKDHEASGLTDVSRGHLLGYLGGIVAFRHGNGLELHNGLREIGLEPLSEEDLEKIVSESHVGEKLKKFLK